MSLLLLFRPQSTGDVTPSVSAWTPRVTDAVRSAIVVASTLAFVPLVPTTTTYASAQSIEAKPLPQTSRSVIISPIVTGTGVGWAPKIEQLRQSPLVTSSFLVLSPFQPAAQAVTIPWLAPPAFVVATPIGKYSTFAKPVQPLNPDGRSDLPWLLQPVPSAKALAQAQSIFAVSPAATLAGTPTLPWQMSPQAALVAVKQILSQVAAPIIVQQQVAIGWQAKVVDSAKAVPTQPSLLVAPLSSLSTIWPLTPPLVYRLLVGSAQRVGPLFVKLETGWTPRVIEGGKPPIVVASFYALVLRPKDVEAGEIINIVGSYQTIIDVIGAYQDMIDVAGSYIVVIDVVGEHD